MIIGNSSSAASASWGAGNMPGLRSRSGTGRTSSGGVKPPISAGSAGATGAPLGSGRAPKATGIRTLQLLLLLAKQGFMEVTPGALPEDARKSLARSVGPHQAVSVYQNPATGEFRALVQDERDREKSGLLSWNGRSWNTFA